MILRAAFVLFVFCGWLAVGVAFADSVPPPGLLQHTLRLMGRFNSGHGCPVSANRAWTSAHVTDLRPFEETKAFPYAYSDGLGNSGFVMPVILDRSRDLALLEPAEGISFKGFLPIASDAPKPGDSVWLIGYDWSGTKKALADTVVEAKVLRVIAGHLIYDKSGGPGSSGSCVVNANGEVVGVNAGGFKLDSGSIAGVGVGVWGLLGEI